MATKVLALVLTACLCTSPLQAMSVSGEPMGPAVNSPAVGTRAGLRYAPEGIARLTAVVSHFFAAPNPSVLSLNLLRSEDFRQEQFRASIGPVVQAAAASLTAAESMARLDAGLQAAAADSASASARAVRRDLAATVKKLGALSTIFRSFLEEVPESDIAKKVDQAYEKYHAQLPADEWKPIERKMKVIAYLLGLSDLEDLPRPGVTGVDGSKPNLTVERPDSHLPPELQLKPADDATTTKKANAPPAPAAKKFFLRRFKFWLVMVSAVALLTGMILYFSRRAPEPAILLAKKGQTALSTKEQANLLDSEEHMMRYGSMRLGELQYADGSWGVGVFNRNGWDSRYVRLPITVIVLRSVSRERYAKKAEEFVLQTLRADQRLWDSEQGDGNNQQPYTLAFTLSYFLDRWDDPWLVDERPRTKKAIEQVLANIGVASWRYVMDDTGSTSFQLMLLGESLLRAKQAGFVMPRREAPSSDSWRIATDPIAKAMGLISIDFHENGHDPLPPIQSVDMESHDKPTAQVARAPEVKAPKAGIDVWAAILENLEKARRSHGGFSYHVGEPRDGETEADAAFRSVGIELLFYRAGRSDLAKLRKTVDRVMKYRGEFVEYILPSKEITHVKEHHRWAKYYYFLSMHRTAQALEELQLRGDKDAAGMALDIELTLLKQRKEDGTWVDSEQATGPAYGTAMVLQTLEILRRIRERER